MTSVCRLFWATHLSGINTFTHAGYSAIGVSVRMSAPHDDSSEVTEILRLKRKLAATHQELDEARGSLPKKIP